MPIYKQVGVKLGPELFDKIDIRIGIFHTEFPLCIWRQNKI